ncbi:S-type pyocin domain-containing protein [Pseudomonas tructae]|nr:S-type pyocin domain-containing protein [Pseudomonas tructae]
MPGSIVLPPLIISDREQTYGPVGGGGYDANADLSYNLAILKQPDALQSLTKQNLRGRVVGSLEVIENKLKAFFSAKLATVSADTESELQAAGVRNEATYQTSSDTENAKRTVDGLIQQKNALLGASQSLALAYSGSDPLTLTDAERGQIVVREMGWTLSQYPALARSQQDRYGDSYSAAYQARILAEAIAILNRKSAALAARQAQLQAAEAEARRLAEVQRQAQEQARLAEAKRKAEEQARLAAEEATRAANTFRVPVAGNKAQLSAVAGSIGLATGSKFTLDAAIQGAIKLLQAAAGVVLDRATGVGIGLLVYSPSLGNSDRFPPTSLTVPAGNLAPNLPPNLAAIAAAGGTVDMPYRMVGSRTQYSLVKTGSAGGLSPKVKVRQLSLNAARNAYTFTSADTPPITLSFPIAAPGNSSTGTPAKPVDVPVYTGVTLTPIQVEGEVFPALNPLDIHDGIYVFPADSGLAPLYGVYSSPYEGATTVGVHSGRKYNPAKAGGPVRQLDWKSASITSAGIAQVKLHTGRFAPSDANNIMIARLEKILRGELQVTDTDKRFYTHEIRELERYRALGVKDGHEDLSVWNDAHTATLEDYGINERTDSLYTQQAKEAGEQQEYKEAMRDFK